MLTPAIVFSISPHKCAPLPLPEDENVSWPARTFAREINSFTDFAGSVGWTTST